MVRSFKLHSVLQQLVICIKSEYVRTIVKILLMVIFILLANHYTACGWYLLATLDETNTNWTTRGTAALNNGNLSYLYMTALHWSLTQFTPAAMDISANNDTERIYSI